MKLISDRKVWIGARRVLHEQMKKNEERCVAVENPEQTSLEGGLAAIKIQDMAAKPSATFLCSLHVDRPSRRLG